MFTSLLSRCYLAVLHLLGQKVKLLLPGKAFHCLRSLHVCVDPNPHPHPHTYIRHSPKSLGCCYTKAGEGNLQVEVERKRMAHLPPSSEAQTEPPSRRSVSQPPRGVGGSAHCPSAELPHTVTQGPRLLCFPVITLMFLVLCFIFYRTPHHWSVEWTITAPQITEKSAPPTTPTPCQGCFANRLFIWHALQSPSVEWGCLVYVSRGGMSPVAPWWLLRVAYRLPPIFGHVDGRQSATPLFTLEVSLLWIFFFNHPFPPYLCLPVRYLMENIRHLHRYTRQHVALKTDCESVPLCHLLVVKGDRICGKPRVHASCWETRSEEKNLHNLHNLSATFSLKKRWGKPGSLHIPRHKTHWASQRLPSLASSSRAHPPQQLLYNPTQRHLLEGQKAAPSIPPGFVQVMKKHDVLRTPGELHLQPLHYWISQLSFKTCSRLPPLFREGMIRVNEFFRIPAVLKQTLGRPLPGPEICSRQPHRACARHLSQTLAGVQTASAKSFYRYTLPWLRRESGQSQFLSPYSSPSSVVLRVLGVCGFKWSRIIQNGALSKSSVVFVCRTSVSHGLKLSTVVWTTHKRSPLLPCFKSEV